MPRCCSEEAVLKVGYQVALQICSITFRDRSHQAQHASCQCRLPLLLHTVFLSCIVAHGTCRNKGDETPLAISVCVGCLSLCCTLLLLKTQGAGRISSKACYEPQLGPDYCQ